jgi:hypothetical protein
MPFIICSVRRKSGCTVTSLDEPRRIPENARYGQTQKKQAEFRRGGRRIVTVNHSWFSKTGIAVLHVAGRDKRKVITSTGWKGISCNFRGFAARGNEVEQIELYIRHPHLQKECKNHAS